MTLKDERKKKKISTIEINQQSVEDNILADGSIWRSGTAIVDHAMPYNAFNAIKYCFEAKIYELNEDQCLKIAY